MMLLLGYYKMPLECWLKADLGNWWCLIDEGGNELIVHKHGHRLIPLKETTR